MVIFIFQKYIPKWLLMKYDVQELHSNNMGEWAGVQMTGAWPRADN